MKLLTWNIVLAKKDQETPQHLHLRRVAKVIFEEADDLFLDTMSTGCSTTTTSRSDNNNNNNIPPTPNEMVWGGADLCCEPIIIKRDLSSSNRNEPITSEASVRIYLSIEDW